jgi:hypothetical protein
MRRGLEVPPVTGAVLETQHEMLSLLRRVT